MSEISAAGDTHTGQVRRGNEDALLVGSSVFAVADGMGGHVAGEVASETALGAIARLDGKVFADPDTALDALRDGVQRANEHVLDRADGDPDLQGMGTTLTVAMIEHRRLHVAHVGDSRAYLLRDDELHQLTQDHTLVQDLLDDGQITPQEATTHPQRSVITRAIGVAADLEVDARTLSLQRGDRILLCSDGLTNVVDDREIATQLRQADDLEAAIDRLIEWANDRGGPDNITAVALAFDDDRIGEAAARTTGEITPIAGPDAVRVDTRDEDESDDWAGRLGSLGIPGRVTSGRSFRRSSRARRAGIALLVLVAVVGLLVAGGRWMLTRSYYVGLQQERVAIFQGIPNDLGPVDLSWVVETTEVTTAQVPSHFVNNLEQGVPAADVDDARRIIATNTRVAGEERTDTGDTTDPDDTADDDAVTDRETADPTPSPTRSPGVGGSDSGR